jgi:hypothetical protein
MRRSSMGYEKLFYRFLQGWKVGKHWCRLWVVIWDSVNSLPFQGPCQPTIPAAVQVTSPHCRATKAGSWPLTSIYCWD